MVKEECLRDAEKIYKILDAKKLESIQALDVHELTAIADVFIIAVASNTRATKALADELEFRLEHEDDMFVYRKEGYDTAGWILLDYGHIIVHILFKDDAEFYGLDRLWHDAKELIF
ncbi:MAG: ribosome silencing factor [Cellulosilyticaceae bacterium]